MSVEHIHCDIFDYQLDQRTWSKRVEALTGRGWLAVTENGLQRVYFLRYVIESVKGALGMANACNIHRVELGVRKMAYWAYCRDFGADAIKTLETALHSVESSRCKNYLSKAKKARSAELSCQLQQGLVNYEKRNFRALRDSELGWSFLYDEKALPRVTEHFGEHVGTSDLSGRIAKLDQLDIQSDQVIQGVVDAVFKRIEGRPAFRGCIECNVSPNSTLAQKLADRLEHKWQRAGSILNRFVSTVSLGALVPWGERDAADIHLLAQLTPDRVYKHLDALVVEHLKNKEYQKALEAFVMPSVPSKDAAASIAPHVDSKLLKLCKEVGLGQRAACTLARAVLDRKIDAHSYLCASELDPQILERQEPDSLRARRLAEALASLAEGAYEQADDDEWAQNLAAYERALARYEDARMLHPSSSEYAKQVAIHQRLLGMLLLKNPSAKDRDYERALRLLEESYQARVKDEFIIDQYLEALELYANELRQRVLLEDYEYHVTCPEAHKQQQADHFAQLKKTLETRLELVESLRPRTRFLQSSKDVAILVRIGELRYQLADLAAWLDEPRHVILQLLAKAIEADESNPLYHMARTHQQLAEPDRSLVYREQFTKLKQAGWTVDTYGWWREWRWYKRSPGQFPEYSDFTVRQWESRSK